MRGRFITFEGGEGSGKSTQAQLLVRHLRERGLAVIETREPGGSPFAERLRSFILDPAVPPHAPLAEALLFYAARADHIEQVIRPALAAGHWVVCDRFSDSTRVYQGAAGGLEASVLDALERIVVGETFPDLTLLLDLDPVKGLERANARRNVGSAVAEQGVSDVMRADFVDSYEARDVTFHAKLRAGFRALAEAEPQRFVVLDAALSAEAIAADVRAALAGRLGVG